MISEFGFADSAVAIEPYHGGRDASAPIRLSYLRYVAEAPECGHWPTNLADDQRNLPYPNFGCAQQHNLAAQIANPADLLGSAHHGAGRCRAPRSRHRTSTARASRRLPRRRGDEKCQVKGANNRGLTMSKQAHSPQSRKARPAASWCPPVRTFARRRRAAARRGRSRASPSRRSARTPTTAEVLQAATADRRLAKIARQRAHGRRAGRRRALPREPDAQPDHHRDHAAARADAGRARPAGRVLRCRHQGGRDRPHQRRACSIASC